VNINMNFLM